MKLADLSTGPDWVVYVGFIIFAVLSIVLISGHGSWLISGYNTASKEEKAKYNEKKLCRTMGIGMSVIACIFRKNCASVPEERSAIPLQTEQSSAG